METERRATPPTSYDVVVTGVRELSLIGNADLTFWRDRLKSESLIPRVKRERAEIIISATDSRWMGLPFQELSIAVSLSPVARSSESSGLYLVQAFNSRRFFAFVERALYKTPYSLGKIEFIHQPPFFMNLNCHGINVFTAEMADGESLPQGADDSWEGPIYLPERSRDKIEETRFFFARLDGNAENYPFRPGLDRFSVTASRRYPVFQWLSTSDFRGDEWRVRVDATHARSRTNKVKRRQKLDHENGQIQDRVPLA